MKEVNRNFHARISGIVRPLLQKVPPTFLLAAPYMTPSPSPDQTSMVSYETTLEVGSNSGVKKNMVSEEFILEHLEAENFEVKERLKH